MQCKLAHNIIAIVCDCDDTLAPDTTTFLLEQNGIDSKDFWDKQFKYVEDGWDPPIAWMTKILEMMQNGKIKQDTNESLTKLGSKITPNKGVIDFVPQIKSLINDTPKFKESDIGVEFYIISSGMEALIRGASFALPFKDIFGGTFAEDPKTGKINAIKSSVTFTEKTKFLYAINKGITGILLRKNPFEVNRKMDLDERRIPFENMIYIGDSRGDIPCFSAVKHNNGQSIGIAGDQSFRTAHALARDQRTTVGPYRGDYGLGSDLRSALETTVMDIANEIADENKRKTA